MNNKINYWKNGLKNETNILYSIFKNNKIAFSLALFGLFLANILFNYTDGRSITIWSVNIWDALFSRRLREYFFVTAENLRNAPHKNGTWLFLERLPWAIWNFPIWLTHIDPAKSIDTAICMIWSKMFLILLVICTGLVCYHITNFFTQDTKKSSLAFLFVLGSSTMMISVGYAGQDEIFYIFFFLLAILMLLKEKRKSAYFLLMYCVTLNPFMIIFAVLVVASMEKRFFYIVLKSIFLFSLKVFESLFFIHKNLHYASTEYLIDMFFFHGMMPVGEYTLSFFAIIVFTLVAIYIFRDKYSQSKKNLILFSALIMCSTCFLCCYGAYRLCIYFPFLVICILTRDDENSIPINLFALTLLDISVFFMGCKPDYCFRTRSLRGLIQRNMHIDPLNNSMSFWQMIHHFINPLFRIDIFLVSFAMACMIFIFYNLLKKDKIQFSNAINLKCVTLAHCTAPLCMLVLFIGLTYFCYNIAYIPVLLENTTWDGKHLIAFNNGQEYKKNFTVYKDMRLQKIDFCTLTWDSKYNEQNMLILEISDSSGSIIFSKNIRCANFKNGGTFSYDALNENIELLCKEKYTLTFRSTVGPQDSPFAVMQSQKDGSVALSIWGRRN